MPEVLSAAGDESAAMARLHAGLDALCAQHATPRLVGTAGDSIEIPPSAFEALRVVVDAMARGQTITLVPVGKELTSQQAAELLLVSRPHLIKLLDRGEIPFHRVGHHRRIRVEDVLAYRGRRSDERERALAELARMSQDAGGYDA